MPGANCAFPGCCVSDYRPKHAGKSLFSITTGKSKFNTEWRNKILSILKRYRELDREFMIQLHKGKKHICEDHYLPSEIIYNKSVTGMLCYTYVMLCFVMFLVDTSLEGQQYINL